MSAKGYYAKSMVVARATGIPYRQNDMVVDAASGRLLIRRHAVERLGLDTQHYVQMLTPRDDGRMYVEIRRDERGLLGQHLRYVAGQKNMHCHARKMARQWCMLHRVRELRMRIRSEREMSDGVRMLEVERVDDMCEMYHWDSRAKSRK